MRFKMGRKKPQFLPKTWLPNRNFYDWQTLFWAPIKLYFWSSGMSSFITLGDTPHAQKPTDWCVILNFYQNNRINWVVRHHKRFTAKIFFLQKTLIIHLYWCNSLLRVFQRLRQSEWALRLYRSFEKLILNNWLLLNYNAMVH